MSSAPIEVAVDFLKQLRPGGPWVVTAIVPDGGTTTQTFAADDEIGLRKFISNHNGTRNLYYSVNPTRGAMSRKASKADIAAVEFVLSDLDPRDDEKSADAKARYLAQLNETFEPQPTAIIDSGNGLQAIWRLTEPIVLPEPAPGKDAKGKLMLSPEAAAMIADIEARSEALMLGLGSKAGTQNVDRILRLPGTTNLPNRKKKKDGRVACPTKLIQFNGAAHSLDAFPLPEAAPQRKKTRSGSKQSKIDVDALPISDRMKKLIRGVHDPEHRYESRSEAVFAVLIAMVGGGCADDQIEAVLMDPGCAVSSHVLDQPRPSEYLARQITRARRVATDPDVAKLNEDHALVVVGDKIAVMRISTDEIKMLDGLDLRAVVRKQIRSARREADSPGQVLAEAPAAPAVRGPRVRAGPRGSGSLQPVARLRGPAPAGRLLQVSRPPAGQRVPRRRQPLSVWVGWIAHIFQHPGGKVGHLAGAARQAGHRQDQGRPGDRVAARPSLRPGGRPPLRHGPVQLASRLVPAPASATRRSGRATTSAEGKLKDLVTGDHHLIEFKGKEPIKVHNFVRLFVTGNPNWLVPAGFEERRFAVLDVGEDHMQDHAYFAAIDREMDTGGREALLDYLLRFDLNTVDLRSIPKTAALLDQKMSSLSPEQAWWLDLLNRGELPGCSSGKNSCETSRLFDNYIDHAKNQGVSRRAIETQIGMFLRKHVPGLRKRDVKIKGLYMTDTASVYEFPTLRECRESFAMTLGQDFSWDERPGWNEHEK